MKIFKLSIFIIFLLSLYSCEKHKLSFKSFGDNTWDFRDSIVFDFDIIDTAQSYNLLFFFRNTLDYPYRNLFLFVQTDHNGTTIKKDTLEYPITNKYGQWLGRGLGKMRDSYFIFNKDLMFQDSGNYKLIIQHGMRNNPLIGVSKLGFKIE